MALLRERVRKDAALQRAGVEADSAGLDAIAGEPASGDAVRVLAERGVALGDHAASRFGERHLAYDLILTMTQSHKSRILIAYPEVAAKVYTLKEYAGLAGPPDVVDPFTRGAEAYKAAAEEIDRAVEAVAERLKKELASADQAKRGETEQ